ncbi:MAG: MerR family transcriptional regulator [Bryobacteraceae bacterium]
MYQARQFANLAGVTVRTLHHYDRMGLLRPRRSQSGYRLYGDRDLERLEQIVALKFIGVSLGDIRSLLDKRVPFASALRRQRRTLEQKRRLIDRAIGAIAEAEAALAAGSAPRRTTDAALITKIIEAIEMQEKTEWARQYYSGAANEKIAARRQEWSPELQERVSRQWVELIREVEAALDEDPAGEKAKALARRWKDLVEGFTGGDPEVAKGLAKLWADRANWPAEAQRQMQPFQIRPEVWSFISKAMRELKS